jgi:hypothetical protein
VGCAAPNPFGRIVGHYGLENVAVIFMSRLLWMPVDARLDSSGSWTMDCSIATTHAILNRSNSCA